MALSPDEVRTVGFIGAGHIGSTLARLFLRTGRQVVLSNSRGPETLGELIDHFGEAARAATPAEAAEAADLVVVTIPLKAYASVPVEQLAGKAVIDTNNYYPARDGHIPELDDESTTVSELLQQHLPTSQVVKAFNTIPAPHLASQGKARDDVGRRALPIAGDDHDTKDLVASLIDEMGFDVVDAGPLAEGWRFQRDTWAYVVPLTVPELTDALARAKRYRDVTPEEQQEISRRIQSAFGS